MSALRVLNWNMMHRPVGWEHLADLRETREVDVALLQEAPAPTGGDWHTWPPASEPDRWRLHARSDLVANWASAVAVPADSDSATRAREVPTTELCATPSAGYTASHPGQFVAVDLDVDGRPVTVVSLYGIWDRHDGALYSEATLHRAISDLTPVLQDRARHDIVVAGDLNIFVDWAGSARWGGWAPRYQTVFDRLAAYDLELVGPRGSQPLEGCICRRGELCRHVRTYAHHRNPANGKYQLDFVLATTTMRADAQSCEVLEPTMEPHAGTGEDRWRWSDHLPVLTTFSW